MRPMPYSAMLFIRRIKARAQAIDRHRQMQRGHRFAMMVQIVQRAGQSFKNFLEWSCRCLHADAPS